MYNAALTGRKAAQRDHGIEDGFEAVVEDRDPGVAPFAELLQQPP